MAGSSWTFEKDKKKNLPMITAENSGLRGKLIHYASGAWHRRTLAQPQTKQDNVVEGESDTERPVGIPKALLGQESTAGRQGTH